MVVDETPEGEIGIMYPDVEVVRSRSHQPEPPSPSPQGGLLVAEALKATPASVTLEFPELEVRLATVEIHDTAQNQLVTSIEILSPVNKREPGLAKYREKWRRLRRAGVNILELDLLRRGQRSLVHDEIPESHYRASLVRAGSISVHLWAIALADRLPILPVPLRHPDADVYLDLGLALQTVYDRAAYDLSIDYTHIPPPPALTAAELAWMHSQVRPVNGASA